MVLCFQTCKFESRYRSSTTTNIQIRSYPEQFSAITSINFVIKIYSSCKAKVENTSKIRIWYSIV